MKKISLKIIYKTLLVGCLITTFSCKKTFEELPKDQVDVTNHYQNVYDANAAVIGIYGKFLGIADRYIVLNELRADLMSPTTNADQYLQQLSNHTETADNPWIDPKPWYNIILNINDAMSHFNDMYKTGKLSKSDYQERYLDIGALRCWIYLQLGTMYGDNVIYVTDPIASLDDLKDKSKFPSMKFQDLITTLLKFMTDGATLINGTTKHYPYTTYSASNPITGSTNSSLNTSVDGFATNLFFINKNALLGDLCLWAGKYNDASTAYRYLADYGVVVNGNTGAVQYYEQFRVVAQGGDLSTVSTGGLSISYGSPAGVPDSTQLSNPLYDSNTLGWRQIFGDPTISTNSSTELIWQLPFTPAFQPTDPFIDLFSNRGGKYLLTASKRMMNLWDGTVTTNETPAIETNGYPFDARRRIAVKNLDGSPVIMKQLYYYLTGTTLMPTNILQKSGRWTLYRSGVLQQHFAEAALNDGQLKLSYALLNKGVGTVFAPATLPADRTNTMQTFLPPPYDMDARSGGPQNYHGPWYRETGTRTRAKLTNLPNSLFDPAADPKILENAIIEESARELSFEGYRWGDLLRVALRRNSPDFLAAKVRDKLRADGKNGEADAAYAKLTAPNGYYLPFKL